MTQGTGKWNFSGGYTQSDATSSFTQGGNLFIGGAATFSSGAFTGSAGTLTVSGAATLGAATMTQGTGTWIFAGGYAQATTAGHLYQNGPIISNGISITAGFFYPNQTQYIYDNGNFYGIGGKGGPSVTNYALNLIMNGTGTVSSPFILRDLAVTSGSTATALTGTSMAGVLNVSGTLDMGAYILYNQFYQSTNNWTIVGGGTITGDPASSYYKLYGGTNSYNGSIPSGVLQIPITLGGTGSTEYVLDNDMYTTSLKVSYTIPVTLSIMNHLLNISGDFAVTVSGILNGGNGTINVGGGWDSSAGTMNGGASTVVMKGSGKTITFGAGQFDNLSIDAGADISMASDLIVGGNFNNAGTFSHGSNYVLNVTGSATLGDYGVMTQGTGTWTFNGGYTQGTGTSFTQGGDFIDNGDFNMAGGDFYGDGSHSLVITGVYLQNSYNPAFHQGGPMTVGSFSLQTGGFYPNSSSYLYDNGNFYQYGGKGGAVMNNYELNLIMNGTSTLTLSSALKDLTITENAVTNLTVTTTMAGLLNVSGILNMGNYIFNNRFYLTASNWTIVGNGSITGTGTIGYRLSSDGTYGGSISANMLQAPLRLESVGSAEYVLENDLYANSLALGTSLPTALSLRSYKLNISGNLVVSSVGVLNGEAGTIYVGGSWDSSLGIFNGNTSTVVMSGSGNTITMGGGEFNNLNTTSSAILSMGSDVNFTGTFNNNGNFSHGLDYALTVKGLMNNNGNMTQGAGVWTFIGTGYNQSAANSNLIQGANIVATTVNITNGNFTSSIVYNVTANNFAVGRGMIIPYTVNLILGTGIGSVGIANSSLNSLWVLGDSAISMLSNVSTLTLENDGNLSHGSNYGLFVTSQTINTGNLTQGTGMWNLSNYLQNNAGANLSSQAGNLYINNFNMTNGYVLDLMSIYLSGNWSKTGGTWRSNTGTIYVVGNANQTLDFTSGMQAAAWYIQNNATVTAGNLWTISAYGQNAGTVVTLNSGTTVTLYYRGLDIGVKNGTITGSGTLILETTTESRTMSDFSSWIINVPTLITNLNTVIANITLGSALTINNTLQIAKTGTGNVSFNTASYPLNVSGLTTIGDNATITQGTGTWTLNGGYTQNGISSMFTQGGNIAVYKNMTLIVGGFTGSTSYNITIYENITKVSGYAGFNNYNTNLVFPAGTHNSSGTTVYTNSITNNDGSSLSIGQTYFLSKVTNTGNIDIAQGGLIDIIMGPAANCSNTGNITKSGSGWFALYVYSGSVASYTMVFGSIPNLAVSGEKTQVRNVIVNLGSNTTIANTLSWASQNDTYNVTLNGSGYALSVNGTTTLGFGGGMISGTGLWNFSGGYLQSGQNSSFTQGSANLYVSSFNITAGLFTGSAGPTNNNSIVATSYADLGAGSIGSYTTRFVMTGVNSFMSINATKTMYSVYFLANTTLMGTNVPNLAVGDYNRANSSFIVDSGVVLNLSSTMNTVECYGSCGNYYSNLGFIIGSASFRFGVRQTDLVVNPGNITAPFRVYLRADDNGNHAFNLSANTVIGNTFQMDGSTAPDNLTFNGCGYTVTATGLTTIGVNTTVNQGTGVWNFSGGYVQSGANSVFVQGGAITVSNFSLSSGTFTGTATDTITVSENFTKTGGTMAPGTMSTVNIIMSGNNKALTVDTTFWPKSVRFAANTTVTATSAISVASKNWAVDSGVNVTLLKASYMVLGQSGAFSNSGTIAGTAKMYFQFGTGAGLTDTITFSTINAPVEINNALTGAANAAVLSLGANTVFGNNLAVNALTAAYSPITLSHGSNYALTVIGTTTLGVNGSLTQGTGVWSFSGAYAQSGLNSTFTQGANIFMTSFAQIAGIFTGNTAYNVTVSGNYLISAASGILTPATVNLIMNGSGKTVGTLGNQLNSLLIPGGAVISMASNVNTSNFNNSGNFSHGSNYALTATGPVINAGNITQGTGDWNFSGGYLQNGAGSLFTQGGNVFVTGNTNISAGTLTGSTSYTWTSNGNFTQTGGTLTTNVMSLVLTGTGTTVSIIANFPLYKLEVTGSSTLSGAYSYSIALNGKLKVSGTLNISSVTQLTDRAPQNAEITGTLTGSGTYEINLLYGSYTLPAYSGTINSPVLIRDDGVANRIATLGGNTVFGSTFQIGWAGHSNSQLNGSNYTLTVIGLTRVTNSGILTQGTGVWNFSGGYLQNGAGTTFTQGGGLYLASGNITSGTFTGSPSYNITLAGKLNLSNAFLVNATLNSTTFTMNGTNLSISSVLWAPNDDIGIYNISKYTNVSNLGGTAMDLNVSYADSDLGSLSESELKMFKYDSSWTMLTSTVNTITNIVSATNVSGFSLFAPMVNKKSWLNISAQSPSTGALVTVEQNNLFNVSATVTCLRGDCEVVTGSVRYNASGQPADTMVSATPGTTPFFVKTPGNPQSCGEMVEGQSCQLNWTINATGPINTYYWLDTNFSSTNAFVLSNVSGPFQVRIVKSGMLNVTLVTPLQPTSMLRYRLLNISARVACLGGAGVTCNGITGTLYENSTAVYPNTIVSTTAGDVPFFSIVSNPQTCPDLALNDVCTLNWTVNATTNFTTNWLLNVTFVSPPGMPPLPQNSTSNILVTIDPIQYCSETVNCAYPDCLYYTEKTIVITPSEGGQEVRSYVRRCYT
jgi:hypothetical protein